MLAEDVVTPSDMSWLKDCFSRLVAVASYKPTDLSNFTSCSGV